MNKPIDVLDEIKALKSSGEPFALATVVRTVAVPAAKVCSRKSKSAPENPVSTAGEKAKKAQKRAPSAMPTWARRRTFMDGRPRAPRLPPAAR